MNSLYDVFFRKETPQNHSKLIFRPEDVKTKKKNTPRPSQKKDHEADISEIDISTSKLFGKGQIFNFELRNFPPDQKLKHAAQGRAGINLHGMAELWARNIPSMGCF